jgi:hypothetical protein
MRVTQLKRKEETTVEKIFFGESQPEEPNLDRCEPMSQTMAPTSSKKIVKEINERYFAKRKITSTIHLPLPHGSYSTEKEVHAFQTADISRTESRK